MKPGHISILKSLLLIGILLVSVISFFTSLFSWNSLLLIQLVAGFFFVFLSCYEYVGVYYRAMVPVSRFPYFPYSFFMFSALKAAIFFSLGLMLISSGTRVQYLFPICFIIGVTELTVLGLRFKKKLCFVSIYANYILFSRNSIYKIFASEIENIEFRHDIFYFIRKNGRADDVRLVHISDKKDFIAHLVLWIEKNKVNVGSESMERLAQINNQPASPS